MTLNQLNVLSDEELELALYIVNVISPSNPFREYEPRHLTWIKHDFLVKRLLDAFPKLNESGHPIFISLMEKMGIAVQINKSEPPLQPPPVDITTQTTASISSSL